MKNLFCLLLLAISFAGFSQTTSDIGFEITLNIPVNLTKDVDFYFLTYSRGVYPQECNYTINTQIDSKTKIHLSGTYSFFNGPQDFLGTICIAVKSLTLTGTEQIQNYFINIGKEIKIGDLFTFEIGNLNLDENNPYITASYVDNHVLIKYESSAKNQADILLSRLTKWIKFQKINK